MFSVMKTELKVFPLCTKNVCPTKSGVTIERRDQVLIGFFAFELFILSIFSRRCDSTKGPFFNDLAISCQIVSNWKDGLCPVPVQGRYGGRPSTYDFFLDRLLSRMNRS